MHSDTVEGILPALHSGSLTTASRLGQLLLETGRGEEGEAVLRRVLQQAQDMNAANEQAMPSWHLAIYVENVAHALVARGNLTGARDLLHQALGLRRVSHCSLHPLYVSHRLVTPLCLR